MYPMGGGEGQGRREDLLQGEAKPASEASLQRGEIIGGSEPRPLRRAKFRIWPQKVF